MYVVRITKLSDNINKMRTSEMEGITAELPQKGESFKVIGEGLEFGHRIFTTSIVQDITYKSQNLLEIKTLNSLYQVEILGEKETSH